MIRTKCAACGHSDVRTWRVLAFAADVFRVPAEAVPEAQFDGQVDGHVPLCPECLRECPTCGLPVVTPTVTELLARLAALDGVHARWRSAEPCDDTTHERPGLVGTPPIVDPRGVEHAR